MIKYFEIQPDCDLYRDYFAHKTDTAKIAAAYNAVCEKFEIKTKQ